jgi:hypothetical protein
MIKKCDEDETSRSSSYPRTNNNTERIVLHAATAEHDFFHANSSKMY